MAHQQHPNQQQPIRVVVTDLDISFMQIMNLMVKFAIASIPAAFILGICIGLFWVSCGAILK